MYSTTATSLAQQESAFLWPQLALSQLPFLFPPRLCVSAGVSGDYGRGKGRQKENQNTYLSDLMKHLFVFFNLVHLTVCVCACVCECVSVSGCYSV